MPTILPTTTVDPGSQVQWLCHGNTHGQMHQAAGKPQLERVLINLLGKELGHPLRNRQAFGPAARPSISQTNVMTASWMHQNLTTLAKE